jgi:hypothetical protein
MVEARVVTTILAAAMEVRLVLGIATTKLMAQIPTTTVAAADRAVVAVVTAKISTPVMAAFKTVTSTAGCTVAAVAAQAQAGAAARVAWVVFASFGVRDVASLTLTQPKIRALLTAVTQVMDVKEIINGIRR